MATSTRRIDAQLEASKLRWGKKHCRSITTVADVAGSLANTYFDLNGLDPVLTEEQFYVYNGTDPAIAGKTGIEYVRSDNDSAETIAAAIETSLNAEDPKRFSVSRSGAVLTVENRFIGAITAETDSGSSGFTFAELIAGVGIDLGATSEAIEVTLETNVVDITSNQTGAIIGSQIYQGSTASISAALIEVTKERFDLLVGQVTGDVVEIPTGTDVSGYGESRLFQALDELGGQLILHPIRLPDTDYSSDVTFWKCAPKPESLNFDGTAPQALSIVFDAYLDQSKNEKINLFARGDWTQEELDV